MKQLLFLLLLIAFAFSCHQLPPKKTKVKPNIVIILTDDQGWGDLSISGNMHISTPNIDKLAEEGVSFEKFYVSPVCSPTRAQLLTGRYAVRGGISGTSEGAERLDLDETTLPEIFKSVGYVTAAYGKWHNGMQPPYHPNARGFDDYYGFCSGHWGQYFDPMLEQNGRIVRGNGYLPDDITQHGLNFIEQHQDQPFLLYLPFNTPHRPMQVPDLWWEKFENMNISQRHQDSARQIIAQTKAALAMVENIDWNVGRIMKKLDSLQLAENTILIFLNDNGPNGHRWNGGMKGIKGSTDEGGVRSPLFMRWRNTLPAGKKVEQISSAMDILPTLVDLADIDYSFPKKLDGRSLRPLIQEENPVWEDRIIMSYWNKRLSVRSQQYRLDHQDMLYDMVADPGQTQDIANQHPEIHRQLLSAKNQWKNEVLVELSETDKRPFTLGHPDYMYTQIPARDGVGHGNIQRSNRWPNCSYFTNWISTEDSISWELEVLADGIFEVELYYTCPAADTGSTFSLNFGKEQLTAKITQAHDPPLKGMEFERHPRGNSYVKDWKAVNVGMMDLKKGKGTLAIKANEIPGAQVMDFRLLMFKRIQ